MSTTTDTSATQPVAVSLFQRAHQRMQLIQRIDVQVANLMEQRQKVQDELRTIQLEINEEIDKVARVGDPTAGRIRPSVNIVEDEAPMMHLTGAA
jgi:hypothetical protein